MLYLAVWPAEAHQIRVTDSKLCANADHRKDLVCRTRENIPGVWYSRVIISIHYLGAPGGCWDFDS